MIKLNILLLCSLLIGVTIADEGAKLGDVVTETLPQHTHSSDHGTVKDRTRLVAHLFNEGYNKKVNPDRVSVRFGVALIDFSICEKQDLLDARMWLRYVWNDARLTWNEEDFGGVSVIRYPSSEVWKPDITLYTSNSVNLINCWDSQVLIYPNGEILWIPPCQGTSGCGSGMSLRKEPYGVHTCSMKFGSWTYDGHTMDLGLYDNKAEIDLADLNNSSGYKVLSTSAERVNKSYPCCREPYLYLQFNLTVQRIPGEELH